MIFLEELRYLFFGLWIPIWVLLFIVVFLSQNRILKTFFPRLKLTKRKRGFALALLGFIALIFAVASPKWGFHFEEVPKKSRDLFVLVDVSSSMFAKDVSPLRIEMAKRKLYDLFKKIRGDRIGIIAFAEEPALICPLTPDPAALDAFLDMLSPDLFLNQGTNLARAIALALESFQKDTHTGKALILVSDGEDFSTELDEQLDLLRKQNIPLYILGIGTPEGAPIPDLNTGLKRDQQGQVVISKLNEAFLQKIAERTAGKYHRAVFSDADWESLYDHGIYEKLEAESVQTGQKKVYHAHFQWLIGIALFCFAFERWFRG